MSFWARKLSFSRRDLSVFDSVLFVVVGVVCASTRLDCTAKNPVIMSVAKRKGSVLYRIEIIPIADIYMKMVAAIREKCGTIDVCRIRRKYGVKRTQ